MRVTCMCVFPRIQKQILGLKHKGCFLQCLFLGALADPGWEMTCIHFPHGKANLRLLLFANPIGADIKFED